MKVIVGLGNPGIKYRHTRHNIGFLIVKALAKRLGISLRVKKFKGILGRGKFKSQGLILFMPMTFMNLSGEAAAALNISDLSNMLIVHDDIDLKFGNIRIRKKGASGGHRGIKSIIENLGTEEFPRLRIGIRGRDRIEDTTTYVLNPFTTQERGALKDIVDRVCECIFLWLEEGIDVTMNRFN